MALHNPERDEALDDALARYWDGLLDGEVTLPDPGILDPALAETVRYVQGLAPAEPPLTARDRVWARVMENAAIPPRFVPNGLPHSRLEDDTMFSPTPMRLASALPGQETRTGVATNRARPRPWPRPLDTRARDVMAATLATAALIVLMLGASLILVRPGWLPLTPLQRMTAFFPSLSNPERLELLWSVNGRTLGDSSPLPAGSNPGANSGDVALLSAPSGIGVDALGNIWVVDGDLDQFQIFDDRGDFQALWGTAGAGEGAFQFFSTNSGGGGAYGDIAFDSAGNIYVADTGNMRIQKFSPQREFLLAWGSKGTEDGQFVTPMGIAIGQDDTVYISDEGRDDVQVFTPDGTFLSAFGGAGRGDGQFDLVSGVAVGPDGDVWVSDWGNNRIHHFDAAGTWIASWGEVGSAEGEIDNPSGVAVDSQGRVYVADQDNNRVQVFTEDGQFLSAVGGNGIDPGEFSWMTGIAAGPDDAVYVIDTDQHSIQAFQMQ